MHKNNFFYIFSGHDIASLRIAVTNRWNWVGSNDKQLMEFPNENIFKKLNLIKISPGLYAPNNDCLTSEAELKSEFLKLDFEENDNLKLAMNKLYPHNHE